MTNISVHTCLYKICIYLSQLDTSKVKKVLIKGVGMTLAKLKEQDGMMLAKVKKQDGMILAK